ncbi:MAG: hypothetical protein AAF394_12620, partial [Planctomycetota bacterium]
TDQANPNQKASVTVADYDSATNTITLAATLVLEQLRRDGNESVKVIMITGNEGNRHQQYAELLGVSDYLRKPFPIEKLVESAIALTGQSESSEEES